MILLAAFSSNLYCLVSISTISLLRSKKSREPLSRDRSIPRSLIHRKKVRVPGSLAVVLSARVERDTILFFSKRELGNKVYIQTQRMTIFKGVELTRKQ